MARQRNRDEGVPIFKISPPSDEPVTARQHDARILQSKYSPPTRQIVAQAVAFYEGKGNDRLGTTLRAASHELYWSESLDKTIFPHALLVAAFTEDRVKRSLNFKSADSQAYNITECVRRICGTGEPDQLGRFAHIFVTLVLCDMEQHIFQFFQRELDDMAFPFRFEYGNDGISFSICPKSSNKFVANFPKDCSINSCEAFVNTQWRVFLPFFEECHHTFEKSRIMPWYDYRLRASGNSSQTEASSGTGTSAPGGGNSEVSRVIIHDGHHRFVGFDQERGPAVSFAVKRLKTKDHAEFNKEVTMLRRLGGRKPHTVKLLATFLHGDTYCLLFPWAECDLQAYWTNDPGSPETRPDLIRWVSAQCLGLISALSWIHEPSGVFDPQNIELYGRHGDIKPENILWYKEVSKAANPLASGTPVISDFGLSALNHKNTCTNIDNRDIPHTTAYAPPDSVLSNQLISRSIDIWALGCVYLEFVTWLIGGRQLVDEFEVKRRAPFLGKPIQNSIFWELQTVDDPVKGSQGVVKVLKPQVVEWIRSLWNGQGATQYVRDFLDIIADDMLLTEKRERKTASELVSKFKSLDRNCLHDSAYYTAPVGGSKEVIQSTPPSVIEDLRLDVLDLIKSPSIPLPQFSGQTRPNSSRISSSHLKP